MRRNQKIHAIAITSICVLVTIIYVVLTPAPSTSPQPTGDRSIEIFDATWGKNCNPSIIAPTHTPPPATADNSVATASKKLTPVQDDNVLTTVSTACNGKLSCQLKATSDTLGVEPIQSCYKYLVVRYRCFSYDRAWDVTTHQGETLTIDCNAASPPATKH
jgi:hypothetical protein